MKSNEKGAALLTTMMLGLAAMTVIAVLLTFIVYGKKTSVVERKYTSALEAAKGASEYIMKGLLDESLTCTDGSGTTCNCSELLPGLICPSCSGGGCEPANIISLGSYSTIGDYNITAVILSKVDSLYGTVYAVEVTSQKPDSPEKAVIEFVYKVE